MQMRCQLPASRDDSHPRVIVQTAALTCASPSFSQSLATSCDYVTTVVYQHDVIPRASLASFEALRREMLATQWEDNLTSEVGF